MKKTRKLISLLMALAMIFALAIPAFAADIIIDNTTTNKTYTAYKIFDATADEGDAVSYTIDSSSAWFSTVQSATNVFTLTQAGTNSTTYYVTVADGVSNEAVIAVFASVPSGAEVATTETGNGGTVTLSNLEAGYYYITTNNGTAVTITTATGTITVHDKNQTPGGDLTKTVSDTTAQIGDTVTYTITSNVPAYDGETQIIEYTFTDTLDDGLTAPDSNEITVKILDSDGNVYAYLNGTDNVSVSEQTITITYNPTTIEKATEAKGDGDVISSATSYPADATIEITYTATVNAEAAYANGNKVTQTWTDDSTGKTVEENVYTYGFNLQKVDGAKVDDDGNYTDDAQLEGAEFKLYTAQTDGEAIKFVKVYDDNGETVIGYKVADENSTNTTDTIEVGYAYIFGLDSDVTYYLEETQAPAGYNVLKDRVSVTIDGTKTSEENGTLTITQLEQVANNAGTELPSTGGMGTTLFYIFGGALVLCAVVLLVTRRRMDNEQ